MTNIELKTMEAVQALNRKVKDQTKIDWEQRRYEIAKEMMPFCAGEVVKVLNDGRCSDKWAEKTIPQIASESAVGYADALIAELKK
jgi:hypothetical protein